MITYQTTQLWQRTWFVALIGGLAVGAGVWWLQEHPGEDSAQPVASSASAVARPAVHRHALALPEGVDAYSVPVILSDGRPSDFTPEDWAALKAAMSQVSNPKAETDRIVSYLRFQRSFERWQALEGSQDVEARHQLARQLLDQVPERLGKSEVTFGEGLMLGTALLMDLEPNEATRAKRLEELRQKMSASAPKTDSDQIEREAQQLAEYKRRQAAIVADWQAKPAASRDQAKLERELDDARRAVYNTKP
ncbi:MAG: hypothetical protein V4532_18785 [Pseudomonadota bacterium]